MTWQLGRTPINALVLSVAYKGVSAALMQAVLGKKGNSATAERKALTARLLAPFPRERIECVTADRERRGPQWLSYLMRRGSAFRLRIPNNTDAPNRKRHARLPGTRRFHVPIAETLVLNRPRRLGGPALSLAGTRPRRRTRYHRLRPRTGP